MGLFIKGQDLVSEEVDMKDVSFYSTMVYGKNASLMQSSRPGGYHSKPHYHDCEQINLCLEGELYFYTDKQAYKLRKGDIFRIPANVIHWAHNKGSVPCVQVSVHAPSFQSSFKNAIGLFDENEEAGDALALENLYVDPSTIDILGVESQKAIGE